MLALGRVASFGRRALCNADLDSSFFAKKLSYGQSDKQSTMRNRSPLIPTCEHEQIKRIAWQTSIQIPTQSPGTAERDGMQSVYLACVTDYSTVCNISRLKWSYVTIMLHASISLTGL
ncbi:hypothetical protein Y1Q_0019981 [Alligator mississippiensis]|uniref:Uncharacterized protein n=1 Tax=Alligator mississippiensis TaxID=8496 RepID=A0A151PEA1_ALLMI|nr:hypothetical protein Y1Q_0019981 [Alligator mississippiensis]